MVCPGFALSTDHNFTSLLKRSLDEQERSSDTRTFQRREPANRKVYDNPRLALLGTVHDDSKVSVELVRAVRNFANVACASFVLPLY